jgi:hypothetical protein
VTNTFGQGGHGRFAPYHRVVADENEGDRLYALTLEEFTAARDALAARMRSAGDAAEAARIKSLKKPTTPAWAVNQLARRQAGLVEQLIDGSERLRRAQHDLLQGGPAQAVWEATLAEREVLGRLTHEAERILAGADYGATRGMLDRISDTLAAAAADENRREQLRRGILTQEMRRAGFGDILSAPAAPRDRAAAKAPAREKTKPAAKSPKQAATPKQLIEAERDAGRLAREADKAASESERLERAATRAEQDAASLRRPLATAERAATRARTEADAARKAAASARRDADKAADRHTKLGGSRRRA